MSKKKPPDVGGTNSSFIHNIDEQNNFEMDSGEKITEKKTSSITNTSSQSSDLGKNWNNIIVTETMQSDLNVTQSKVKNKEKVQRYYKARDFGPFVVYVESTDKSGNNIGRFNHLKISKEIFNLKLKDIKKYDIKGTNRISVEFNNYNAANSFTSNAYLMEKGYNVFIPFNYVTCKGIVRNVDTSMEVEELQSVCNSSVDIINIVRLNRKVFSGINGEPSYVPTNTILLTFEGIILPKYTNIYGLDLPVVPYISPVTQCFNCLLFGHTKKLCKSKQRCFNCGDLENHEVEGSEVGNSRLYDCQKKCFYCKSEEHSSTFKKCPEYERQQNIKKLMAFENISYFDANNMCKKTYLSENNFTMHPADFPLLSNNRFRSTNTSNGNNNKINVSERRLAESNSRPKRSFQQVTSEPPKKKFIAQKGFDQRAHNEALFAPNSRLPRTAFSQDQPGSSTEGYAVSAASNVLPYSAQQNNFDLPYSNNPIEKIYSLYAKMSYEEKNVIQNLILANSDLSAHKDVDKPTYF